MCFNCIIICCALEIIKENFLHFLGFCLLNTTFGACIYVSIHGLNKQTHTQTNKQTKTQTKEQQQNPFLSDQKVTWKDKRPLGLCWAK